ncbi:MAG: 3-methyl-2-oxobutanoate hydroxymethyltransferase [Deltaproteobacteria bacterium]|jgi:3-methyl-2-oxobutanoate hydroxymethyltransferase|nr:3-methyl-2-oxobutanoate hydroxymethyltransferase [Deltaproteobacteria bacterium]
MPAKKTVSRFAQAKRFGDKLTMLTAYDYSIARLVDQSGVDAVLVGDSLGNVVMGLPDTLQVTMEQMIHHTRAVAAGVQNAMVVGDMPFMSYQVSVADAVLNAGRLVKEGRAQAVKLEGGVAVAPQIRAIVDASIPVMGHIGLTPQSVNAMGGLKVQGKGDDSERLMRDALAVQEAGAFSVVVECVPAHTAEELTKALSIPTIGIGAGPGCDGQILVYHDMLGLFEGFQPKFVKQYADAGGLIKRAFAEYVSDVKAGTFPGPEHTFNAPQKLAKLY